MFSIKELYAVIDAFAPFRFSDELVRRGDYDNSGIIVKTHDEVKKVLFSLDLSDKSVKKAKSLSCDTVITHHPAIYHPIRSLNEDDKTTSPVLSAAKNGINVISCHLNLDVAKCGIDDGLAKGLGGKDVKLLDEIESGVGYGREFTLDVSFPELKKRIKESFGTDKFLCYKNTEKAIKCASFCGGGSSYAIDFIKEGKTDADLIVTSDMPHHVLKELTEYGKSIIILPHYVAEEYGFKKFYESISEKLSGKAQSYYFSDKRFF